MKKLKFEIVGNLANIAFPDHLIKTRKDLLAIILESCRFMMQNSTVEHADNLLMLVVNDMNRLFYCKDRKMYSVAFPFHTDSTPTLKFDLEGIDISPAMISNLISVINSNEFEMPSGYDFFTPIIDMEDNFSQDFWIVLKYLLTFELGYIRYDDDLAGFKKASKDGHPKRHPRHHFDINYSGKIVYKIGLEKRLTPDIFVDILDDSKDRKILKL